MTQYHETPVAIRNHQHAKSHNDVVAAVDVVYFVPHRTAQKVVVYDLLLVQFILEGGHLLTHALKIEILVHNG